MVYQPKQVKARGTPSAVVDSYIRQLQRSADIIQLSEHKPAEQRVLLHERYSIVVAQRPRHFGQLFLCSPDGRALLRCALVGQVVHQGIQERLDTPARC